MIKIDYINGTVEDFTVVLSNRNLDKQGQILNIQDFNYKGNLASAHEISFSVYKYVDGVETNLWREINNLKIVWVKELDMFFETRISLAESTNIVKKITGISLCEAELSQTPIRNTEINSEADIARPDYVVTKFYNPYNKEGSLLHRILSVVPHYSIKHVDESLWNIQRTFSIDGTTVYDFLMGELAEQIGCLFQFDSNDRSILVYDLQTVCKDCGYRGEYLDYCTKCGSSNLSHIGEDTTIFVSADNLTDEVVFDTDVDAIKNCFFLKTGDEIMDAAVIACNPNGSAYLYYFSEEQKADMPDDLRNGLNDYDVLVDSYSEEYQTLSEELYECIDDILYYQSGMMPPIDIPEVSEVNATTEASKLTVANLSPIGLSSVSPHTSTATVNSALKNYAKVFVKSGFVKIEIESGNFEYKGVDGSGHEYGIWNGKFKVTNYSNEEDIAYSDNLIIGVTEDYETFLNQKILKNISNNDTDDGSVYNVLNENNLDKFKEYLTNYSYNRLESFLDAIQGVINILVEENQGQPDSTYYSQLYKPYYDKLQACQAEMDIRSVTIDSLKKTQDDILKRQSEIQSILNLQDFLGEDLYKLFCAYRREDTYQNDNFISDGLNNEEIFDKAKEFIELAKNEIVKSGEHQHSISSNLYNLLVMEEFAPIKDKFELGNWIRCKVDDEIYRLRLISYEISGKSLSNVNTEFSELTKTACGVNDIRSILNQAQSMASSYSYISKQSEQGKKAQDTITDFLKEGLDSSLVNIKNNNNEEVTFDNNGILCRTWDDIADDYSPEQLRLTHNILCYTSDNWETVSLGLGKHDYYKYVNDILVRDTDFGLSAKFVTAGYINGSQIIGGEIYSQNYSPTLNTGTYINLNDGSIKAGRFSINSQYFQLNYDGSINSTYGYIGGFFIQDNFLTTSCISDNIEYSSTITSIATTGVELGHHAYEVRHKNLITGETTYPFAVRYDGKTSISNGDIGFQYQTDDDVRIPCGTIASGIFNDGEEIGYGIKLSCNTESTNGLSGIAICANDDIKYLMNDGWSPYGYTERHIFFESTLFTGDVRFLETVYDSSSNVITSDKNKKNTIEFLDIYKSSEFIYSLNPVKFKYNDGNSNRFHHGLIAQDVKESMGNEDWGLYVENNDGVKGLRYEELIADLIATVQTLNKRIEDLERK